MITVTIWVNVAYIDNFPCSRIFDDKQDSLISELECMEMKKGPQRLCQAERCKPCMPFRKLQCSCRQTLRQSYIPKYVPPDYMKPHRLATERVWEITCPILKLKCRNTKKKKGKLKLDKKTSCRSWESNPLLSQYTCNALPIEIPRQLPCCPHSWIFVHVY